MGFLRLPTTHLLNLNLLTFGANQTFMYALIPLFVLKSGLPIKHVVLSFSFGTLFFLIGSPYWSKKADVKNPLMILTMNSLALFFSVLALLLLFLHSFDSLTALTLLVLGRGVYGLGASGLPAVSQQIRMNGTDKLLKGMFSHSASLNIGRTLGPCLLLIGLNTELVLLAFTLWTFILIILNALMIKQFQTTKNKTTATESLNYRALISPALVTLSFTLILGLLHSGLGIRIQEHLLLSAEAASQFMARLLLVGSIAMVVVQLLGKKIPENRWKETLFSGGLCLTVGILFFSYSGSQNGFYAGIIFSCLGLSLLQPSNIIFMESLNLPESQRGSRLGHLSAVNTLGYALGGVLLAIVPGGFKIVALCLIAPLLLMCFHSISARSATC
jgi:predicted MFS family arabinose efflux permease